MSEETSGASEELEVKPERKPARRKKVTSRDVSRITAARERTSGKVVLRSLWPGKLIVTEDQVPSGERYVFPGGGSTVSVAEEDVPALLARQRSAGCCGTGKAEPFFELA